VTTTAEEPVAVRPARPAHLRWWKELLTCIVFYLVYSWIRNQFGSEAVQASDAFRNAERIIDLERLIGTFHEETIQEWFLDDRWFIQFWNLFYGSFHFVVTAFALIYLYVRQGHRYIRLRTTLAVTTALALIGFALFPLMPPRLLPDRFGFVDTLRTYGGLWSFDDGALKKVSNQYAAMPSLHFAWATWSAMVLVPAVRQRWLRVLVCCYPLMTLFAITVTANHYWIDAAGGALILGLGYLAGSWWDTHRPSARAERAAAPAGSA
jgi:hypothetical protein